jgi:hypothetical protein
MKTKFFIASCLLICCLGLTVSPSPGLNTAKNKSESFSAMAVLPSGAGRRMIGAGATANVTVYIDSYSTDEEVKTAGGAFIDGGPEALLKVLEKSKSIGKITLARRTGFYDLKLIRSRPTETGRLIFAVLDRPIGFLEAYYSGRSEDYKFGVLMLELKTNKKGKEEGTGTLVYAAKIKLLEGNRLEIENYGNNPVQLLSVRKF